jgi:hypothetical protein
MKPSDLSWLKEFTAAQRGVPCQEISDEEVISRHRRRWIKFFSGLLFVVLAYFLLRFFPNRVFATSFVAFTVLLSLGLQFWRFRSAGRLTGGSLLLIKKQAAEKLKLDLDDISDAAVHDYDRLNQRAILLGLLIFAIVSLLTDLLWLNSVLEVLMLVIFYSTGLLAWSTTSRRNYP